MFRGSRDCRTSPREQAHLLTANIDGEYARLLGTLHAAAGRLGRVLRCALASSARTLVMALASLSRVSAFHCLGSA